MARAEPEFCADLFCVMKAFGAELPDGLFSNQKSKFG
jgi:hypothetical protein